MHVGVGAVVVGKDKAARVGREKKKSPPEAYQSVLNCFIITEMHRRNFLLKIMQSLISLHSLKAVASLPHFPSPECTDLTSSCIRQCGAVLSTA